MKEIKPIGFPQTFFLFFTTSTIIFLGLYRLIPSLLRNGLPFFSAYLIAFYIPFVLMFALTFLLYRLEGRSFRRTELVSRLRLERLERKDAKIVLGLFVACLGTYATLSFSGRILAAVPLFAPPDFFPSEINPLKAKAAAGLFMDYPMKGNWWMPACYILGWFFNIFGEELLWRGYLLPRMELRWGGKAWIVNGALWALWHCFWKWNLLVIAPTAFLIPLAAQKTKKTWIGILVHGTMNLIPGLMLVLGAAGIFL